MYWLRVGLRVRTARRTACRTVFTENYLLSLCSYKLQTNSLTFDYQFCSHSVRPFTNQLFGCFEVLRRSLALECDYSRPILHSQLGGVKGKFGTSSV